MAFLSLPLSFLSLSLFFFFFSISLSRVFFAPFLFLYMSEPSQARKEVRLEGVAVHRNGGQVR
jgi:hypothetical protein